MDPAVNIASNVARQALAAGIGLGAAAATVFVSSQSHQTQEIQLVEEVARAETLNGIWAEEFLQVHGDSNEARSSTAWTEEFQYRELEEAWAGGSDRWVTEFDSRNLVHGEEFSATHLKATEFMESVDRRIEATATGVAEDWASEYEFQFQTQDRPLVIGTEKDLAWKHLESAWEDLAEEETFSVSPLAREYKIQEGNPFLGLEDPLAEGKRLLAKGEIPMAAQAFEAAALQAPGEMEPWMLLGTTQAQNEEDPLAISALNQALRIQPRNLTALLALAASLTNEAFPLQAAEALKEWLRGNTNYAHLLRETTQTQERERANAVSSILSMEEMSRLQEAFLAAARLQPRNGLDPDVQSGLGILFNLGNDYGKAADCFRTALGRRPNDSLLWNRLGATLANGGKSAEAISAYRRALEISPRFIRTRYNLGVSCINLDAYQEAAEHFLIALSDQAGGTQMSEVIWKSLGLALSLLERSDLTAALRARDLAALRMAFGLD